MSSAFGKIVTNLGAILAIPNATGVYTHDLTLTDRVHTSLVWPPPKIPCVMILDCSISSQAGNTLDAFTRTATFDCVGYTDASTDTVLARTIAAGNLLDDVCRAIGANRAQDSGTLPYNLGGTVYETEVTECKAWGTPDGVTPSYGVAEFTIQVTYKAGVGA